MYRSTTVTSTVSPSSAVDQILASNDATFYQTNDLHLCNQYRQVAPTDGEVQVNLAPVTTGYFIQINSDYPIMVRFNGSSATQFTMHTNSVAATNVNAVLPDMCVLIMPVTITSLYIAPIPSAAQTANVKIVATGDPSSAYV